MKKILLIAFLLPLLTFGQSINFQNNKVEITNIGKLNVDSTIQTGTSANTYVTIDATNSLRMYGGSTTYDDLMFPFSTGHQGNLNYPPFNKDSLYFSFGIDSVGGDAQFMYFVIQLPHKWKEGSTIYPHVHYKYETGSGTPTFIMKYKWYNIGESTQVGWKWYRMGTTTGTTDKTHQLVKGTGGISGVGKTISSILICKIYLESTTGTPPVNAYQFDIHYEIDSFGSKDEYIK